VLASGTIELSLSLVKKERKSQRHAHHTDGENGNPAAHRATTGLSGSIGMFATQLALRKECAAHRTNRYCTVTVVVTETSGADACCPKRLSRFNVDGP
jgi:hypothetical protein